MRLAYTQDKIDLDCRRLGHDWPSRLRAGAFMARGLYWEREQCPRCGCTRELIP